MKAKGLCTTRLCTTRLCAALALLLTAGSAFAADDYPNRPIRFIVPFSAGGPTDTAARLIAEPLQRELGQTIVIENRPGAAGVPATEAVVSGAHDGYTLVVGGIAPIVLIPAVKTVRYDVEKDLVPLGLIWQSPQILAVRKELPVNSVKELIDYAKANPNKLTVGSAGVGTVTHLANELFKAETGITFTHVPYRSTSNSVTDLRGGQIDAIFGDIGTLKPQLDDKGIKALAITSKKRSPLLPDLKTMAELGYPNVQTEVWFGLFTPTGAPEAVIKRLKDAVRTAQADPGFKKGLEKFGAGVETEGADGFAEFLRSETKRWTPLMKAAGITF